MLFSLSQFSRRFTGLTAIFALLSDGSYNVSIQGHMSELRTPVYDYDRL